MEEALLDARLRSIANGETGTWSRLRIRRGRSHIPERDGVGARPPAEAASPDGDAFAPLTAVAASRWRALAERAIEPNGYYLPGWELAVNAFAAGRTGVSALSAWSDASPDGAARLIGLMPVISMWRACKIPLPALVSADPYGTLCTPLLDRDTADDAAARLDARRRAKPAPTR